MVRIAVSSVYACIHIYIDIYICMVHIFTYRYTYTYVCACAYIYVSLAWGFPKIRGPFLKAHIIGIMICLGRFWGPTLL